MLRVLREHATSWMLRGILILVAVTFISWGGYSLIREKKSPYAAKVDGAEIEMKDYSDAYEAPIRRYRRACGSSVSQKLIADIGVTAEECAALIAKAGGLAVGL